MCSRFVSPSFLIWCRYGFFEGKNELKVETLVLTFTSAGFNSICGAPEGGAEPPACWPGVRLDRGRVDSARLEDGALNWVSNAKTVQFIWRLIFRPTSLSLSVGA